MAKRTLGFIGVGDMGGPMAGRLLDAGYGLVVHDVNPSATAPLADRGADVADSPKAVADAVESILVSLPTPDVVRQVALGRDGIVEGAKVRHYVDLSTTGAVMAQAVAAGLAEKNIAALDCPVSGGIRGAEAGTLALMISGPPPVYEELRDALLAIGENPFYLGEAVGLGQTMKLTNNYLSAVASIATAEAIVMGVKAGLDAHMMIDVINKSSGRNDATVSKFPNAILNRKFTKSMKQRLLYKDVKLCMDEAEALGVPMWLGNTAKQFLSYAITQGTGDEPSVTLIKHIERWAGVTVGKAED